MTLQIDQLANEQVNVGTYLDSDGTALAPGSYSFSMQTIHGNLPFTLSVSGADTNLSLQEQLADQINRRHIDVRASIIKEGNTSALMLASADTGTPETVSSLYFTFDKKQGAEVVDTFGLNQIQTYPENARFYINDLVHSSTSNHISINQVAEFDFHKVTDTPVNVQFTPDKSLLVDQMTNFTDAYNQLVTLSEEASQPRLEAATSITISLVLSHVMRNSLPPSALPLARIIACSLMLHRQTAFRTIH